MSSDLKQSNLLKTPVREPMPGFQGSFFHTDEVTIARWHINKGSVLPEHHHENRQIMHLVEGRFAMTIAGQQYTFGPGDIIEIPGDAPHTGEALEDCLIYDIFIPVRNMYE